MLGKTAFEFIQPLIDLRNNMCAFEQQPQFTKCYAMTEMQIHQPFQMTNFEQCKAAPNFRGHPSIERILRIFFRRILLGYKETKIRIILLAKIFEG